MKTIPAIIAAFVVTAVVAVSMLVIGGNALINQNRVPVSNAPKSASLQPVSNVNGSSVSASQSQDQQIQQLQSLVKQYQDREKTYQSRLNQAAQQLTQANQQVQAYQQVLNALQQRGIIQITNDGQILISRGFGLGRGDD